MMRLETAHHLVHSSRPQRRADSIADGYRVMGIWFNDCLIRYVGNTPFAATMLDSRTSMGFPWKGRVSAQTQEQDSAVGTPYR